MRQRYGSENETNLGLLLSLYRAVKALRRREGAVITEQGLTFAQFEVLELLYHLGEQRIGDLIDRTLSSIGNVSLVLDNLEKEGLVERHKCESDRRVTFVRLSKNGQRKMKSVFPKHLENVAGLLGHLSAQEKRDLTKLLIKMEKKL